jgi:glycerophosphoryl diester phosphodiesterase
VIVIHDATVDRTTNGNGSVAGFKLDEIRALDAGAFFSEKFKGVKVPTLSEVFEAVGKSKLINIELTNYYVRRDNLVEQVCALIKKHNNHNQILFSSFFPSNLKRAAELLPQIPRGLLALDGWKGIWTRSFGFMFGNYQALHPWLDDTSARQVSRVHQVKRRIHVWTVNKDVDMERMMNWDVDGIFTDDPQMAVRVLRRSG